MHLRDGADVGQMESKLTTRWREKKKKKEEKLKHHIFPLTNDISKIKTEISERSSFLLSLLGSCFHRSPDHQRILDILLPLPPRVPNRKMYGKDG